MADTEPGTLTFLFWNSGGGDVREVLARLDAKLQPDVLILAEAKEQEAEILLRLNSQFPAFHLTNDSNCNKITILTRFPFRFIRTRHDMRRYTIRQISLPGSDDLLLVAAHLPSRLHTSAKSISEDCVGLSEDIRRIEEKDGHDRTIVVGDFNLNPFEDGIIKTTGLHATMSRAVAKRGRRTVQDREYPFFYNPMWSHLGDAAGRTGGTYYYDRAGHVNLFWNIFDQVLVRPSLMPRFSPEDIRVVESDGARSLLTDKGVPDNKYASDHLPITFKVKM
jgi:hypothetical protein